MGLVSCSKVMCAAASARLLVTQGDQTCMCVGTVARLLSTQPMWCPQSVQSLEADTSAHVLALSGNGCATAAMLSPNQAKVVEVPGMTLGLQRLTGEQGEGLYLYLDGLSSAKAWPVKLRIVLQLAKASNEAPADVSAHSAAWVLQAPGSRHGRLQAWELSTGLTDSVHVGARPL